MMNLVTKKKQQGLTFANFILGAILFVFLALAGLKIIPAYVENRTVTHILETVAHAPEMQDAQPSDIRGAFDKGAMVNNITTVDSREINIQRTPMGLVLSLKYAVKISLVGNASLVLDFDSSSTPAR